MSHARRSSRKTSLVDSAYSVPPASRPGSRLGSSSSHQAPVNVDPQLIMQPTSRAGSRLGSSSNAFDGLDFDPKFIDWLKTPAAHDGIADMPSDISYGNEHGTFAPPTCGLDMYGNPIEYPYLPEATHASMNLLQNSLSALPQTPTMNGLNYGPLRYGIPSFGFPPYVFQSTNVATGAPTSPSPHPAQVPAVVSASPREPKPPSDRSSRRASKAACDDLFMGYDGNYPSLFDYPDPDLLDNGTNPYYRELDNLVGITEYPDVDSERHQRGRTSSQVSEHRSAGKRSRDYANLSERSSSTYPDRSRSNSVNTSRGASNKLGHMRKRKSVFAQPFAKEKPKADPEKAWVRTNATTRGLTTRTAKLNNYDPKQIYKYTPHPLGDWSSARNEFKYTTDGEWKEPHMTAAQIQDFILNYPEDKARGIYLKLWIQVGPTDSARRYFSPSWSKCRFAECPANTPNQKGTILHGHYRVAFDERWYGDRNYDPHVAACGYVHLYCMERFLDFEFICRKAHVQADNRQISTEPKGRFAASLAPHPECSLAEDFVSHAHRGRVRKLEEFRHYPVHQDYNGNRKPHEDTLTYQMHIVKENSRPPAQMKQFEERGLKATHLIVNRGDLEVLVAATKANKKAKAKANIKKRKAIVIDSDDEEDASDIEHRNKRRHIVAEAGQELENLYSQKSQQTHTTRGKHKTPPAEEPWTADDNQTDDDFDDKASQATPSRRSKRTAGRWRPDYREVPEVPQPPQRRSSHRQSVGQIPSGYRPATGQSHDSLSELLHMTPPASWSQRSNSRTASLGPYIDPELEGVDFDTLFPDEGLGRRTSSSAGRLLRSGSILRSPSSRHSSMNQRRASFAQHPVTEEQTFDTEAPPQEVESHSPPRAKKGLATEIEALGAQDNGRWAHKLRNHRRCSS